MGFSAALLLGSCSVPLGVDTRDLVESGLSNVEIKTATFLQGGTVVSTLRSGVEATARIEFINPKNLVIDYSLRWEDDASFVSLPRVTTSQPTLVEIKFILQTGAEHKTIALDLGKTSPSTGKTFPTDTLQILCDSPPDPVQNLVAANTSAQRAMMAFTLSEAPTQDDLVTVGLKWRNVSDTANPGAWESLDLPVDAPSLLNAGSPDLLEGVSSTKKRYFQPTNVVAGGAYQFSVTITDQGGQSSTPQTTSTSKVMHTLTYSSNDGSGFLPSSQTVAFGTSVTVDPTALGSQLTPPSGTVFGGWNTNAQGTGTNYSSGTSITLEADLTLYARWVPLTYYTLSYSANGGSGSLPSSQTVLTGTTVTVDPPALGSQLTPPSGTVFGGWNTNAQGTGTTYSSGTSITLEADLTLYARWVPLTYYTLSYSANGGSGSLPSSQTVLTGTTVTVDPAHVGANLTPPSGKAFNGWNTAAQGNGTAYSSGSSLVLGANVTLYAQWRLLNTVTVTFEPSYVQTFKFETSTKTINRDDTLEVAPVFDTGTASDWRWYVDGVQTTTVTSDTFTGTLSVGFHNLVVFAKVEGVLYSGTLSVTVVNK